MRSTKFFKLRWLIYGGVFCLLLMASTELGAAESIQPILVTSSTEFTDVRIVVDNSSGDVVIDQLFPSTSTRTAAVVYLRELNGSYQSIYNYSVQVNVSESMTWLDVNDTMDYLGRGTTFPNVTLDGFGAYTRLYTDSSGLILGGTYTDTDTTYSASGTLLNLATTTFSVNEGTLTDGKICFYNAGTGIECTLTDSDTDTTYTNGTGLNLASTTFSIKEEYINTTIDNKLTTIYHNLTVASIVAGTSAGVLASTQHQDGDYDGLTFNLTEASGSPGLDARMNYTNITTFNAEVMRYYTSNLAGDYPVIQVWDYDDGEWEDYPSVVESESFATIEQPVFDSTDHIQDGVVAMRLYKAANGNTQNHYYLDWLALISGPGTPAGEEVDPYWKADKADYVNYTYWRSNTVNNTGYCSNVGEIIVWDGAGGSYCTNNESVANTYTAGWGLDLATTTFSVDPGIIHFYNDSTGTVYMNNTYDYLNITANFTADIIISSSTNFYVDDILLPSTTTDASGAGIIGVHDGSEYWDDDNVQDILEDYAQYLDWNANLTWRDPVKDKDIIPCKEPTTMDVGDRYIIAGSTGGDWYPNLPYRDNLSVRDIFITKDMVNYTVLIVYDDCSDNRNLFTLAAANGTDITFTLPDHTTKLSHELVNYRNTSGDCYMEAYIRLPNMTGGEHRYFDMAYGNSTLAMVDGPAENKYDAWDEYYETVAHMEWDEGTAGNFHYNLTDSTRYDNNITAYKCVDNYTSDGIVGGYVNNNEQSCAGTWMNTSVDRELSGSQDNFNFTVSLWGRRCQLSTVYAATFPDGGATDPEGASSYSSNIISGYSNHKVWFNGNSRGSGTNILSLVDWHMLGYSANGSEGIVYEDGAMSADWYARKTGGGVSFETINLFSYGVDANAAAGSTYFGQMDEFRFSTTIRSAEWYNMEMINMRYPDLFIVHNSFEINPGGGGCNWSNYETHIAEWDGSDWQLPNAPAVGWAAWVSDESKIYSFDGSDWFAIDTVGQSHDQLQNLYGCDPITGECWHFKDESDMTDAITLATDINRGLAHGGWSNLIDNAYQAGSDMDWDVRINDNNATISLLQSLDSKGFRFVVNGTRMYLDYGHDDAGFQYQNNIITATNLTINVSQNIQVALNLTNIGELTAEKWCAVTAGGDEIVCDKAEAVQVVNVVAPITGGGSGGTVTVAFDDGAFDPFRDNDTFFNTNASAQETHIGGLWTNASNQDGRLITLEGRPQQPLIYKENISTTCSAGQILKNQSGGWACAADATAGGAAITTEWSNTGSPGQIFSNSSFQTVNVTRNLTVQGQIQQGITDTYYCPELKDDNSALILSGLVMSAASTTFGVPSEFTNQINCPRNVVWDTVGIGMPPYTCSGTLSVWGIDTNGRNITDTMAFTGIDIAPTDNGLTSKAYSRVTRYSITENSGNANCMNLAVNIGSGTYIGMPNYPTNSAADYFKIMNDTVDITTLPDWVNKTYGTINFATYLSTDRDELTVWARYNVKQT